jgi:hypothetical protein
MVVAKLRQAALATNAIKVHSTRCIATRRLRMSSEPVATDTATVKPAPKRMDSDSGIY